MAPEGGGYSFSSCPGKWKLGEPFPAERVCLWNAETLGLHAWIDGPEEIARRVRGWFSAGKVATIALGDRYAFSASRWLADPIEDAPSLHSFASSLQAGCNSLGINLKGSPGSAAVAVWEKIVRRPEKIDTELNAWCEDSIYGGRAETYWTGESTLPHSQWDRSSAYLAHLRDELPVAGSARFGSGDLGAEGISEAIVEAWPDLYSKVPALPAKVMISDTESRTVYGWGRFWGRWPNVELRAARDRGYRIRLLGGVTFERSGRNPDLISFSSRLWNAKRAFPLAKRIGLALVGKLHENRTQRVVAPFGPFRDWKEARRAAVEAGPGSIPIPHARVILKLQHRDKYSWYANMAVASHVLALARLELLRFAEANLGRLATLATDGAILVGTEPPSGVTLGPELGGWRLDFTAKGGASVHGPLAYRLSPGDGSPDKVRTAGVSRALAGKFLSGEAVEWGSRAGLLARSKAGELVHRRVRAADFSGDLRLDPLGFREPPRIRALSTGGGQWLNVLDSR